MKVLKKPSSGRVIIKSDAPEETSGKLKTGRGPNYRIIDRYEAQCLRCHQKHSSTGILLHIRQDHGEIPVREINRQYKPSGKSQNRPLKTSPMAVIPAAIPKTNQTTGKCPYCLSPVNPKNLERHIRKIHSGALSLRHTATDSGVTTKQAHPLKFTPGLVTQNRFAFSLSLEKGSQENYFNAAKAVRSEYSSSVKWKQMRCLSVSQSEKLGANVFKLEITSNIDLGWSWEGGLAFKPAKYETLSDPYLLETYSENAKTASDSDGLLWAGEVIELDNENGFIYISVGNLSKKPSTGSFYIKPFEFLRCLDQIYNKRDFSFLNETLASRLAACSGSTIPAGCAKQSKHSINLLENMWRRTWSVLWGPPGTGKTTTVGRQVASVFNDPEERILIVSTTNKATDEVALKIGEFLKDQHNDFLSSGAVLRIGKGAGYSEYETRGLLGLLKGTETSLLRQIESLQIKLNLCKNSDERAAVQQQLKEVKALMINRAIEQFMSADAKVIVSTAFKAMELLCSNQVKEYTRSGTSPFSTIIIDEAGLISRAAGAALSLLGAVRVVWVGDPRQLAPISKAACSIPPEQAKWLACSCLSHLQSTKNLSDNLVLLNEQHRMHPEISKVVSGFQYDDSLVNGPDVMKRAFFVPQLLQGCPRAVWHVLDREETNSQIGHERGAGEKSWKRPVTEKILKRFFLEPAMKTLSGIFVTPFKAQAVEITKVLKELGLENWTAATIHSFQGTEADIVILDTVFAGSRAWDTSEWKRLINVGISRGKHFAMVLASRAEMSQSFMQPLAKLLKPMFLRLRGSTAEFTKIDPAVRWTDENEVYPDETCLGGQLARMRSLRPVMSYEQRRLCNSEPDGKPRLVRGVAGSGKTYVLANWLVKDIKRLESEPDSRIFVVYGNHSLQPLLEKNVSRAWADQYPGQPFPRNIVVYRHIKHLLEALLATIGKPYTHKYEYDEAACAYLEHFTVRIIPTICNAMFLDEAQDMGPNTLKLLFNLIEKSDKKDSNSRAIHIFYDNAQNLYDRKTPKWSELGISLTGRSTIMKESFRSTRQISEYAINCLYNFQSPDTDHDYRELVKLKLIEPIIRNGQQWRQVNFNQNNGLPPDIKICHSDEDEIIKIGSHLEHLIRDEKVKPGDICIVALKKFDCDRLEKELKQKIRRLGADISFQTGEELQRNNDTVLVTTAHSFKGYDAEIIIIAFVNRFCISSKDKTETKSSVIRGAALYVAMTRARSILLIYGSMPKTDVERKLVNVLTASRNLLAYTQDIEQLSQTEQQFDQSKLVKQLEIITPDFDKGKSGGNRYIVKHHIGHSEVVNTDTGAKKTFYDIGAYEKATQYAAKKNAGK